MVFSNEALLPTKSGNFKMRVAQDNAGKEHVLIYQGALEKQQNLPVRVHSECLTSEVLGSLRCDCREQLWTALEYINHHKNGLIIYLRQEGRGIGLFNKMNAYALQDCGRDTIDANLELGFPIDMRTYEVAANILQKLAVQSINLLTNNPDKVSGLTTLGITINKCIPLEIPANAHNFSYLKVKKEQMNHTLGLLNGSIANGVKKQANNNLPI